MDVQWGQRRQGVIGEGLHAVDETADAVGLVDDKLGERGVVGLGAGFQQLRGAADPGERVLDLMGQHAPEADDGTQTAGRLGVATLDAQPGLHGQGQQHRAVAQGRRGAVGLEGREAEKTDLHAAFANLGLFLDRAVQERDQGRARREGRTEPAAGQEAEALAEQRLCGLVHGHQGAGVVDHHGRVRAELEGRGLQRQDVDAQGLGKRAPGHAASLRSGSVQRAVRLRSISLGSSRRQSTLRANRRSSAGAGHGALSM